MVPKRKYVIEYLFILLFLPEAKAPHLSLKCSIYQDN